MCGNFSHDFAGESQGRAEVDVQAKTQDTQEIHAVGACLLGITNRSIKYMNISQK